MPKMQLEDFNHAMLRTIYAFYLLLYTLGVFQVGLLFYLWDTLQC